MEAISTCDIFKIGVGPSSSHTMGPWRAALLFLQALDPGVEGLQVHLYGSLAKTGIGHGTHIAVQLGLQGQIPEQFDTTQLDAVILAITEAKRLKLGTGEEIPFDSKQDIVFHREEALPEHPNGITFTAAYPQGKVITKTYFSIGGGFVVERGQSDEPVAGQPVVPHEFGSAAKLSELCHTLNVPIWELALLNEEAFRPRQVTLDRLDLLAKTMVECTYLGCYTEGILPGGLNVTRRAAKLNRTLLGTDEKLPIEGWCKAIRASGHEFENAIKWVSCFALAVNEVNAAFGRVVTAPTNGAAGVIPAVLLYHHIFGESNPESLRRFLLTAAQVAIIFKRNATISAALGGCQAEIGVSSAMAAAAFVAVKEGDVDHSLMAAEIAMEHHLGMTCDPIGGLVQIPCIERNTMGAVKAITAANIALYSDPSKAKVSLDAVVGTMWRTAQDMNNKYKETSEGGLAVQIPVNVSEC